MSAWSGVGPGSTLTPVHGRQSGAESGPPTVRWSAHPRAIACLGSLQVSVITALHPWQEVRSESPRLVATLVRRVFDIDIPLDVQIYQALDTVREIDYPDLNADGVVLFHDDDDPSAREAFVVEVQLRPDEDKRYSWPMYVGGTRRRLRCPVTLVVITTSQSTARWCSEPIDLGRGCMILRPLVIGPDQIPRSVAADEARNDPDLAVLAVIAHGRKPGSEALGRVALEASSALAQRGDPRATLLIDLILAFLDEKTLERLENMMDQSTDTRFSPFAKRHFASGREEGREAGEVAGRVQALLSILQSRGLELGDVVRRRVLGCTDASLLDSWICRAATAEQMVDVFLDSDPTGV